MYQWASAVNALSLLTTYVNSFKGMKTSGTGISVTSDLEDITITNSSPASSIRLTSTGSGSSLLSSSTNPNFR